LAGFSASHGNETDFFWHSLFPLKGCVKSDGGGWEVDPADEGTGFRGAMLAVHLSILPFNRQRSGITNIVQGANDLLKID